MSEWFSKQVDEIHDALLRVVKDKRRRKDLRRVAVRTVLAFDREPIIRPKTWIVMHGEYDTPA